MRTEISTTGRKASFIEEARRAQIVLAAAETVADLGYFHASLSRIAERAGISKSVISYHFGSKEDLLAEVAGEFFQQTWQVVEPRIEAESSACGKIGAWITAEVEYFAADRSRFLAVSDVIMSHRAADGSRPFATDEAEAIEAMTEILRGGQAGGELRDFEPGEMAELIISCIDGILGRWAMNDGVDLLADGAALADFIGHAIARRD